MAWTFYDRFGRARTAVTTTHPVGTILAYGGSVAPPGWLICDGAELPKINYPELSTTLGSTYNVNGSTPITDAVNNFRIPDFRGHSPMGAGTPATGSPGAGVTYTHGTKAGERLHALTVGEVPRHTHADGSLAAASQGTGIAVNNASTGITVNGNVANITSVTGGNHTHTPAAGTSFLQSSPAGDPWQGTDQPNVVSGTPGAGQANFSLNMFTINRASFTPHSSLQTAGDGGHAHTINQSNHAHTITDPQHFHGITDPGHVHDVTGTTENGTVAGLGAGSPTHNNVGPVLPTNFIIKF